MIMLFAWLAVVAGALCCGVCGYVVRAFIGDRREDRAYDDGWADHAAGEIAPPPVPPPPPAPTPVPPSPPSPSSPSSPPSPSPPSFSLVFAASSSSSSPPAPTSPSSLPPPLRPAWRWNEADGRWAPQDPLMTTFARALLMSPLDAIPALFGTV